MATRPAAPSPFMRVRDKETLEERDAFPIDAKELVASGHYEYVGEAPAPPEPSAIAPAPENGLTKIVFKKTGDVSAVFPIDAKELVRTGEYAYAADVATTAPAADATQPSGAVDALTPIVQLAAKLAAVTDGDELLTLEAADPREEAKALYLARFEEIANAPRV